MDSAVVQFLLCSGIAGFSGFVAQMQLHEIPVWGRVFTTLVGVLAGMVAFGLVRGAISDPFALFSLAAVAGWQGKRFMADQFKKQFKKRGEDEKTE